MSSGADRESKGTISFEVTVHVSAFKPTSSGDGADVRGTVIERLVAHGDGRGKAHFDKRQLVSVASEAAGRLALSIQAAAEKQWLFGGEIAVGGRT